MLMGLQMVNEYLGDGSFACGWFVVLGVDVEGMINNYCRCLALKQFYLLRISFLCNKNILQSKISENYGVSSTVSINPILN